MTACDCFARATSVWPDRYDFILTPTDGETVFNELTNRLIEVVCATCHRRFYVGTWEMASDRQEEAG